MFVVGAVMVLLYACCSGRIIVSHFVISQLYGLYPAAGALFHRAIARIVFVWSCGVQVQALIMIEKHDR
jgi:hypothetical protein